MAIYPELGGKTAVVTGGNQGIGYAIAEKLIEQHVRVAIIGRDEEKTSQAVAELSRSGAEIMGLAADLTNGTEAERMANEVRERFGGVDILVNNAGGFRSTAPLVDMLEADWDEVMANNLKTAFLASKVVLRGMMDQRWGRIINVAAGAARMPTSAGGVAHYVASKTGLLGFTRYLAREVGPFGVTVNATAPGQTYTDRIKRSLEASGTEASAIASVPLGRLADPEDQAKVVVYLASDEASYVTGATVDTSGGRITL